MRFNQGFVTLVIGNACGFLNLAAPVRLRLQADCIWREFWGDCLLARHLSSSLHSLSFRLFENRQLALAMFVMVCVA